MKLFNIVTINTSKGNSLKPKDVIVGAGAERMIVKDVDTSNPGYDVLTCKPYYPSFFSRIFEAVKGFFWKHFWLILLIALFGIGLFFIYIHCKN